MTYTDAQKDAIIKVATTIDEGIKMGAPLACNGANALSLHEALNPSRLPTDDELVAIFYPNGDGHYSPKGFRLVFASGLELAHDLVCAKKAGDLPGLIQEMRDRR